MKILKSKFYKDIKCLKIDGDNRVVLDENLIKCWETSETPFSTLLRELLPGILPYDHQMIIREKKFSDFEKCEDFVAYTYSNEKNKLIFTEECYFHKDYEVFIVVTSDLSIDSEKELYEKGVFRIKDIYFDTQNIKKAKNIPEFFEKYLEKYISPDSKISLLVKDGRSIELNEYKIFPKEIDFKTMYNDDFLEVNDHIIKELKTNSKGIILLHGLPGTGKTNYIKWLTGNISEKKFIFVPLTMIHSLLEPEFISFFIENKNSVLVIEDCENYISERNSSNPYSDVVGSILNLADGILSDVVECQIICTFNANINKIDSALLRKGRLIAEYGFKKLDVKKANKYFKSINLDYKTDKPLQLSEATNIGEKLFKEQEEKGKIGFNLD